MLAPPRPDVRPAPTVRRDLATDAVRAGALLVVVLWHLVLSMDHRNAAGRLSMPNPVDEIPGGWALTWAFQVMPIFVVLSGAVNGASWARAKAAGSSAGAWTRSRLTRLGTGAGVVLGACAALELAGRLLGAGSFLGQNFAVVVPLWTLAVLALVTPLTPALERLWDRWGLAGLTVALPAIAVGELARFGAHHPAGGMLSTLGIWTLAYQLGWVYRHRPQGPAAAWIAVGFGALAALIAVGPYPAAMVATRTSTFSPMLPTTAPLAALAVAQLGLLLATRDRLARWLDTPRRTAVVQQLAGIGMAVYLLHMFALVVVMWVVQALGFHLTGETSATWWALRPFWALAPALVLVPMVRAARTVLR